MKTPHLLLPSMLCAALLGSASLVFALGSPRQPVERASVAQVNGDDRFGEVFPSPSQVTTLEAGVSPHLLVAP